MSDKPDKKETKKKPAKVPDIKIETVQFKYPFTPDERIELAAEADRHHSESCNLDGQLSSIKKDFGGRIELEENLRDRAFGKFRDGFEMRETKAVIAFNRPKKGLKSLFHFDDKKQGKKGALIREEPMSEGDFQREFILAESEKAKDKPKELKPGEDLNPVAMALTKAINIDDAKRGQPPSASFSEDNPGDVKPRVKSALEEIAERGED